MVSKAQRHILPNYNLSNSRIWQFSNLSLRFSLRSSNFNPRSSNLSLRSSNLNRRDSLINPINLLSNLFNNLSRNRSRNRNRSRPNHNHNRTNQLTYNLPKYSRSLLRLNSTMSKRHPRPTSNHSLNRFPYLLSLNQNLSSNWYKNLWFKLSHYLSSNHNLSPKRSFLSPSPLSLFRDPLPIHSMPRTRTQIRMPRLGPTTMLKVGWILRDLFISYQFLA